jgi:hypothetical protein
VNSRVTAALGQWLKLGRVSNLPTVWSNALAAMALSGGKVSLVLALASAGVMSVFYVAGMILNDVFDASYDAGHRPNRPIPSGAIKRRLAAIVGFVGLLTGVIAVAALAYLNHAHVVGATVSACLLALSVVAYDLHHKQNTWGPLVMGACRALVFVCVALIVSSRVASGVLVAAVLQWLYVVGLTYAAKQEDLSRPGSFWPVVLVFTGPVVVAGAWAGGWLSWLTVGGTACLGSVWLVFVATATIGIAPLFETPKRIGVAIGRLIAGVAMLDALTIATSGWVGGVVIAACCAVLTRIGQRYVPGT